MRRWILPIVLLVVAAVAAWQAVSTDAALAEETTAPPGSSAPAARTPLLSVRRVPEFLRLPVLRENLQNSLQALVADFPAQSCLVVNLDGEQVFAENASLPLVPASAQKLLTAFAVYELVGAEHTWQTRLVTDAEVIDGVVQGDVWLIGGGDPLLAVSEYANRYDPPHAYSDIERLADAVVALGITEIAGAVMGDETRFDDVRYVPDWPERFTDAEQNQTGPLSALTVNDGFTSWDPENTANSLSRAASDPAQFAAAFFDDLLEAREVVIRQSAASGEAPVGAGDLVEPLVSDVAQVVTDQMMSVSDNMAAELLLKEIGLEDSGTGTTLAGAAAVESLLRAEGFSTAETDVVDGSGLASENRVSCQLLVEVLEASAGTPVHDGLAVAGESGTLEERLVNTIAEGKVRAKTGRLNEVGALAGTAETGDGSTITFAWIGNTTDFYPVDDMIDIQDRLAIELVEYPEGPTAAVLGPL
ncbi:MAG: D-alanyl-D-alanine carboxypeptidase/D-alanyl-D-alanine endopeptidase [Acidimicrobiales bacterium]